MRARIRKEMETPSSQWNNEWQQVKGPESFLLSAVQNPKLIPLQGKSIAEIAKLWNKDPIDTVFDILIQDEAFTMVGMFIMDEPDVALAIRQPWVSICNDSQGSALDGVLGIVIAIVLGTGDFDTAHIERTRFLPVTASRQRGRHFSFCKISVHVYCGPEARAAATAKRKKRTPLQNSARSTGYASGTDYAAF